jgi:septal ring factor EnvC (AmiA/AmiB activator)
MKHFLLVAFLLLSTITIAQTKSELEKERQQIEQQIKQLNNTLNKTSSKRESVLERVNTINQRISVTERLVKLNNRESNLLTREIEANAQAIDKLRSQIKALKASYSKLVVDAYKSKSQQNRIMFLLSSDNFKQAFKRLEYMKQFAAHRKEQAKEIEEQTKAIQKLNNTLFKQRKEKEEILEKNRAQLKKLNSDKIAEQELIATILKDENKYKREIKKKQTEVDKIDKLINELILKAIAEENKKVGGKSSSRFKMTPEATLLGNKFEDNKGKLPWPVISGFVSRPYGTRRHAVVKTVNTTSQGVRIQTEENGQARAVYDGEVSQVLVIPKTNLYIILLRHGQYLSVYKNISQLSVKKGDKVKRNQFLGTIGKDITDGKTTLGFYIYKNNKTQNPADWIYKM